MKQRFRFQRFDVAPHGITRSTGITRRRRVATVRVDVPIDAADTDVLKALRQMVRLVKLSISLRQSGDPFEEASK